MMEDDHQIKRIDSPDDPDRCQGIRNGEQGGQCTNKAVPNGTFCMAHGGNRSLMKDEKQSRELYQVAMFNARIARNKNHDEVKTLSNEVAILRMMLESKLNACQNDTDLLLSCAAISDLVIKIDKVVVSCHKLEKNLGQHMDKASLLQFAGEVVALVSKNVSNKQEIAAIAEGMTEMIGRLDNNESAA